MRPRYKLAEVRPDGMRSLGRPEARTLSTRHAQLVIAARSPRVGQIEGPHVPANRHSLVFKAVVTDCGR